jgi:hypothetical protein
LLIEYALANRRSFYSHCTPSKRAGAVRVRGRERTRAGAVPAGHAAGPREPGAGVEARACGWGGARRVTSSFICRRAARSLRALHKAGFVHRDLKVGDVLMRLEDEDEGSGKGRGVATRVRGVQGRPLGA